jgi:ribosomal protein S18 acetylase RimI-like enzyme
MLPIFIHDKAVIERFLLRDPFLHLYELGDLDDFFWPYTSWMASRVGEEIQALFLIYHGGELPILLATERDTRPLAALLEASLGRLPKRFYTHLSPGLADILRCCYRLEPHGLYLKMRLEHPERLAQVECGETFPLTPLDAEEVARFYDQAYPGNWFDARMLETGGYYAVRRNGSIAAIAGIHVYSPQYRVAALGNITTLPEWRGQGLSRQVTARLCRELLRTVDTIGLNVRADNQAALAVYTRLGFTPVAEYEEYLVEG